MSHRLTQEIAEWLVSVGYPIDWNSELLPPEELRRPVEDAWIARDGDDDGMRETVREEGGWS